MFPKGGWISFDAKDSLVKLIWNLLKIKDQGGLWDYYNFTSDSSIWANGDYNLILQFINEDCEQISSLELNIPDHQNAELNLLIVQFNEEFGLIRKYC